MELSVEGTEKSWAEIFAPELKMISDLEIREWVVEMLHCNVENQHKTVPASSTGKYHPACSNGEGGLVRHTKLVVHLVEDLLRARPEFFEDRDVFIAAAILHDMSKYHDKALYVTHDHPHHMAVLCIEEGMQDVADLIDSHMGIWNTNKRDPTILPVPQNEAQWLLHYADYIASRNWIQYTFDKDDNLVKP